MVTRRLLPDRRDGLRQDVAHLARHGRQFGVLNRLHRRHRIDGADFHATVDLAQDDVAWQHRTDARFDPDGLMRHLGVAGAEDAVGGHLDI